MKPLNVDPELLRDPGYRGALYILTSRTFRATDPRLWRHVYCAPDDPPEHHHSIEFHKILDDRTWSSTETLMLRAAWSLFNQDSMVNLWELVNRLDDEQMDTLLTAMACAAFSRYVPDSGLLHEKGGGNR